MTRYTLTIDVPERPAPAVNTLRRVLKWLWRAWGVRCVKVQEVKVNANPCDASL